MGDRFSRIVDETLKEKARIKALPVDPSTIEQIYERIPGTDITTQMRKIYRMAPTPKRKNLRVKPRPKPLTEADIPEAEWRKFLNDPDF